ncbi:hypothetical protein BSKO_09145 [Bryopsis sp. KO-2023]|nr:hypothetical protein BSKO_09145 [Bryopsis sp. KO-2023]
MIPTTATTLLHVAAVFALLAVAHTRAYDGSNWVDHSPAPSAACEIEASFIREGNTFNDPSKLLTSSPEECCRKCRGDPKCESWTRDRRTKACALKDDVVELWRNHDFDSGVVGGSPATQDVPIDDRCIVERGVDFKGEDMREEDSADAEECCRKCEEDLLCFSWSRHRSNGRCFLKSGVPARMLFLKNEDMCNQFRNEFVQVEDVVKILQDLYGNLFRSLCLLWTC